MLYRNRLSIWQGCEYKPPPGMRLSKLCTRFLLDAQSRCRLTYSLLLCRLRQVSDGVALLSLPKAF